MYHRAPNLLITDIMSSTYKILKYTKDSSYEDFINDTLKVDAVLRNFEIICEAERVLSEDYKVQYSNIDWHQIREFRNKILLDYIDIDLSFVWEFKNTFLPTLILQLERINL